VNKLLWRLREPDEEIGPGKHGKRLWTRIWMICTLKWVDAMDCH